MTYTDHSPLLGPSYGTLTQCLTAVLAAPRGSYTPADVVKIITRYFVVCGVGGVDPVLAIAQMLLETGNLTSTWSQRPRRNPAGIGVTGEYNDTGDGALLGGWAYIPDHHRWERGVSFPSWADDAIPAHVGRLLCYALPIDGGTQAQQSLIQRALSYRAFPPTLRGTAPILRPLGAAYNPAKTGWATPGEDYGAKIATIANRICQ